MRQVFFLANANGPIIQTASWNLGPVMEMWRKGRERRPDMEIPDTRIKSLSYPWLGEYDPRRALRRALKEVNNNDKDRTV